MRPVNYLKDKKSILICAEIPFLPDTFVYHYLHFVMKSVYYVELIDMLVLLSFSRMNEPHQYNSYMIAGISIRVSK